MEKQLTALIGPLFPSLDSALVDFLAAAAASDVKGWKTPKDVVNTIGEMLESYEAVENEKEALEKCTQLFNELVEKGLSTGGKSPAPKKSGTPSSTPAVPSPAVSGTPASTSTPSVSSHLKHPTPIDTALSRSAPSKSPSSSPSAPGSVTTAQTAPAASPSPTPSPAPAGASASAIANIKPGYTCKARYSGDGLFYRAVVTGVQTVPVMRIKVKFIDYGDEESVPPNAIKDVVEGTIPDPNQQEDDSDLTDDSDEEGEGPAKLLNTPFQIGPLTASRAQRRVEAAQAAEKKESEMTPKELKLYRKRLAKAQKAAEDLEKKRTFNPHGHRDAVVHNALPIYLQSQHLAKKAGTKDINVTDVQLLAPDNTELLTNAEIRLVYGRKYGLVGRNGIGKTTLLRQISTYAIPKFPQWIKIQHVEQECVPEPISVLQVVLNSDLERSMLEKEEKELNAKLKEMEAAGQNDDKERKAKENRPPSPVESVASTATTVTSASSVSAASKSSLTSSSSSSGELNSTASISDRLSAIYERLQEIESHSAVARASMILAGLQFSPEMQSMPTKALSGGWRMRVALACALFVQPDLLLLDEPTNHLDYPAVLWLQSYLQSYEKTVLIVSHDRTFLNSVITDVIHFTNRKRLEYYRGDYENFVHVRAEKYKADKRAYESQQMYRQHLQDFITTFRTEKKSAAQDRKVGQAMSKQKILDKMELLENPDEESVDKLTLSFPEPGPLRLPMICEMKHVFFKYPKRIIGAEDAAEGGDKPPLTVIEESKKFLLEDISVRVELTSRIGILGANGCGKTTLIKVLLGTLQPIEGTVWLNSNVEVAYFTQHHVDQLNLGLTAVEWLKECFPGTTDVVCRRHLGRFGLIGEMTLMQIGNLSGGQKSRLAFSRICWSNPHLLILDEPTNHLDFETIDVLIKAINEFKGAIVIISHDQHFLQGCVKEFWSITDRKLRQFDSLEACRKATYSHVHA